MVPVNPVDDRGLGEDVPLFCFKNKKTEALYHSYSYTVSPCVLRVRTHGSGEGLLLCAVLVRFLTVGYYGFKGVVLE